MNRKTGNIKIIIVSLLCILFFTGCKTVYKIPKSPRYKFKESILKDVSNEFIGFNTFSGKIKLNGNFTENDKTLRGVVRIKRDSIIWISVNLSSGLPLAKMQFTNDSILILNRLKNELYAGNYEYLKEKFNIDLNYKILESIIVNEFIICKANQKYFERDIIEKDSNFTLICKANNDENYPMDIKYSIDREINKIKQSVIEINDKKYSVKYFDFTDVQGKNFPSRYEIFADGKNEPIELELTLNKINLNRKQRYPFKVGKKVQIIN